MSTTTTFNQKASAATDLIEFAQQDIERSAYTDAAYNLHLAEGVIQAAIWSCVQMARDEGATWSEIGQSLALTPQGAQQRYGPRPTAAVAAAAELVEGQLAAFDD
jgi:hypothetical protein